MDDRMIQQVWNRGRIVPDVDPNTLRKDACGAWIARNEYGLQTNRGWEIHHIRPKSKGGPDLLGNLVPLQWNNNRETGDGPLACVMSAV